MTEEEVKRIMETLSTARIAKYVEFARDKESHPLDAYLYNERLSGNLNFAMSMWEIVLRNRLSQFLLWKYSYEWPFQERLLRQLSRADADRLRESSERQKKNRKVDRASTDSIVADLSVGFWVSLLTRHYEVPFAWRPSGNLSRVFPHRPNYRLTDVQPLLLELRNLRNRIAHREPILLMDLPRLKAGALELTSAMCADTGAFVERNCRFDDCWNAGPGAEVAQAIRKASDDQRMFRPDESEEMS